MANGFGSLYVGSSGLRGAQNALNIVANNLSNIDTTGYVRQQVAFQDTNYNKFSSAAVSPQLNGTGLEIGQVIHARDEFLDRAYRTENGRQSFYQANADAIDEIQTLLQESNGTEFKDAISDLYTAFAEFAKDPSSDVNQNLVIQKSELFVSRSKAVYKGLTEYQEKLNTKIKDDVDRINEIGKSIVTLNKNIQRIEAGHVETAKDLRDQRDSLLDELSGLAKIEYSETADGVVRVRLEGTDFITEHQTYAIGLKADQQTGYYTPYWTQLSTPSTGKYTPVFNLDNVESRKNNDIGEIRGLLLARGDHVGRYTEIENASAKSYKNGIGRSAVMNSQAELDKLTHTIMTKVNDLLSPTKSLNDYITESGEGTKTVTGVTAGGNNIASVDADGNVTISSDAYSSLTYTAEGGVTKNLSSDSLIFDDINPGVGASGKIPSEEIFSRVQGDRYDKITLDTPLTITYSDGSTKTVTEAYLYRPETTDDRYSLYTLNNVEVNQTLVDSPEELPSKRLNTNQDNVIYDIGSQIDALWENIDYQINPADDTKCSIMDFYTKYVGELANSGSVYTTTAESLDGTSKSIESSRQGVIGVSSDDELTNMIKYQNAYNASSRYINVVSTMIDYLLNSLT
jgi:flagellar hook-associated protein 1 FlgK